MDFNKRILNPARVKIWNKMLFFQDWGGFLISPYSYFANMVMKKFKVSVLMSADKAFTKVATQPLRKLLFVEKRLSSSLDI